MNHPTSGFRGILIVRKYATSPDTPTAFPFNLRGQLRASDDYDDGASGWSKCSTHASAVSHCHSSESETALRPSTLLVRLSNFDFDGFVKRSVSSCPLKCFKYCEWLQRRRRMLSDCRGWFFSDISPFIRVCKNIFMRVGCIYSFCILIIIWRTARSVQIFKQRKRNRLIFSPFNRAKRPLCVPTVK